LTHIASSSSNGSSGSNSNSNHDDSESGSGGEMKFNINDNSSNNNDRRNGKRTTTDDISGKTNRPGFSLHVQPPKKCANQTSVRIIDIHKGEDDLQISGMLQRLTQLENLVATQSLDIRRLQDECRDLTEAAVAFQRVVELLRQAGLDTNDGDDDEEDDDMVKEPIDSLGNMNSATAGGTGAAVVSEYKEIFGTAPASVIEAADAAGIAILAGMLGGKQRLLWTCRVSVGIRNARAIYRTGYFACCSGPGGSI
jgi:hypothetical protein